MKWRVGKVSELTLIGLTLFAVLIFALAEKTSQPERQPYFQKKLQAANLALLAQQALKEYSATQGIKIDPLNDPYGTGLIGQERTPITSDRGVVTSKILAANPNFAAAFVELLLKAKVKRNGVVAVGLTGSLPGWNIAFYSACKALNLRPIIITSVGSSDWGANLPALTWLDMERVLIERGIFPYKSVAASIGGGADNGRGLSPEGRDLIRTAIKRNKVLLIEENTLEESIQKRMEIYQKESGSQPGDCYVNIGGGVASLGGGQNERLIPPGLSKHLAVKNFPVRAVMVLMAEKGIPVIQLLEVEKLGEKYGLPYVVEEEQAPEVGQGSLFFKDKYSISGTIFYTSILVVVLFVFIRIDVKHYIFRKKRVVSQSQNREGI